MKDRVYSWPWQLHRMLFLFKIRRKKTHTHNDFIVRLTFRKDLHRIGEKKHFNVVQIKGRFGAKKVAKQFGPLVFVIVWIVFFFAQSYIYPYCRLLIKSISSDWLSGWPQMNSAAPAAAKNNGLLFSLFPAVCLVLFVYLSLPSSKKERITFRTLNSDSRSAWTISRHFCFACFSSLIGWSKRKMLVQKRWGLFWKFLATAHSIGLRNTCCRFVSTGLTPMTLHLGLTHFDEIDD